MMGIECLLLIPFTLNYRSLDKTGKWAYYYLISSVLFALGSSVLARIFRNNLWFYSVMNLGQFVILSAYYYQVIKNDTVKKLIKILIIPAVIIFFLDFFKLEGILTFNSIFATVRTFLLLSYGIIFFVQLLFDEDLVKESIFINSLPNFWFNSGLFIYLCCSFFDSLTYNFLLRHLIGDNIFIGSLVFISGIIEAILFYIGLLKAKKLRA
ncbi:MAG TPA: hypothetical protein VGE79_11035 [Niastella sp.]